MCVSRALLPLPPFCSAVVNLQMKSLYHCLRFLLLLKLSYTIMPVYQIIRKLYDNSFILQSQMRSSNWSHSNNFALFRHGYDPSYFAASRAVPKVCSSKKSMLAKLSSVECRASKRVYLRRAVPANVCAFVEGRAS